MDSLNSFSPNGAELKKKLMLKHIHNNSYHSTIELADRVEGEFHLDKKFDLQNKKAMANMTMPKGLDKITLPSDIAQKYTQQVDWKDTDINPHRRIY